MNIIKKMMLGHMANQAKRELERVLGSIKLAAKECEYNENEMLDWPKWPYMLKTPDEEYVCTLNEDGKKNLMLFITEDEAKQFGALFEAMTKQKSEVVQPTHFLKFDRDCILTIRNCGFEMWYGTYKSHVIIEEVKSMQATGLL